MNKDIVLDSINFFPLQIEQVIDEMESLNIDGSYKKAREIFLCGMGGSIYSYYIINCFFYNNLTVPITAVNDYHAPKRLSEKSLFISCSYSGSTEETLSASKQALEHNSLIVTINSAEKSEEKFIANNHFLYRFVPKHNPSAQPRIGMGYMIFAPILLLSKLGYLKLQKDHLKKSISVLKSRLEQLSLQAKQDAVEMTNKAIVIVASGHLSGTAHVLRNQINETAKTYAQYNILPELNHHFLEGLTYPKKMNLFFLLYDSNHYIKQNRKRLSITHEILKKQNYSGKCINFNTFSDLDDLLISLQYGSYLSYYLAKINKVDPSQIPWVDYFKKELSRNK